MDIEHKIMIRCCCLHCKFFCLVDVCFRWHMYSNSKQASWYYDIIILTFWPQKRSKQQQNKHFASSKSHLSCCRWICEMGLKIEVNAIYSLKSILTWGGWARHSLSEHIIFVPSARALRLLSACSSNSQSSSFLLG